MPNTQVARATSPAADFPSKAFPFSMGSALLASDLLMPTEADTCRKFVVPKLQASGWEGEAHRGGHGKYSEIVGEMKIETNKSADRAVTFLGCNLEATGCID